jgi:hypothetical protein
MSSANGIERAGVSSTTRYATSRFRQRIPSAREFPAGRVANVAGPLLTTRHGADIHTYVLAETQLEFALLLM